MSAATGKDSIRALIVANLNLSPHGSKLQKYVTRVPGWQKRLTSQLRELWKMARRTGPCHRPGCTGWRGIFICRKTDSPNKGKKFLKCNDPACGYFQWVDSDIKHENTKRMAASDDTNTSTE